MTDLAATLFKTFLIPLTIIASTVGVIRARQASKPALPLAVPYISQVPDGVWVLPWSEACEEASLLMIHSFLQGETLTPEQARDRMETMITWENETLKKNTDTNAEEIVRLAHEQLDLTLLIKRHPSLDVIQAELRAGRPVIALVNMFTLYQEPTGQDSYHVVVLTGYDPSTHEFRLNDPARQAFTRVSGARLAQALHDYSDTTHEADGPATVLFIR